MSVKAKKYLGQHFLKDETIAKKIADTLTQDNYKNVLEIGPGMGAVSYTHLTLPTNREV